MKQIKEFIKLTRVPEWAEQMQGSLFFAIIYLVFSGSSIAEPLVVFFLYQICIFTYGFTLNSITDREIDQKVSKKNFSKYFPNWFIYLNTILWGLGALLLASLFGFGVLVIGIVNLALATFYSARPFRLKARGLVGLASVSLATTVLPFVFLLGIVNTNLEFGLFLAIAVLIKQLYFELSHQIIDFGNDKKTKVKTWAVRIGMKKARWVDKILAEIFVFWILGSFFIGVIEALVVIPILLISSFYQIHYIIYGV